MVLTMGPNPRLAHYRSAALASDTGLGPVLACPRYEPESSAVPVRDQTIAAPALVPPHGQCGAWL